MKNMANAVTIMIAKELWTFAYEAAGSFMFAGSRTTPTVDGDLVHTVGPLGDLHAISTKTREPVWRAQPPVLHEGHFHSHAGLLALGPGCFR